MDMKKLIASAFDLAAVAFEKVPFLSKLKGYRTVLGLVGLAIVMVLKLQGVGSPALLDVLEAGFGGFSVLAANAKGR